MEEFIVELPTEEDKTCALEPLKEFGDKGKQGGGFSF